MSGPLLERNNISMTVWYMKIIRQKKTVDRVYIIACFLMAIETLKSKSGGDKNIRSNNPCKLIKILDA